jgi:ABC-type polysaccharide/polyol phosphate export permease
MTAVIVGWRWTMLGGVTPDWEQTLLGAAVGVTLFVGGLTIFRTSEPRFADTI